MKKPSHPLTGPEQIGNIRSVGSLFKDRGWLRTFLGGKKPLGKKAAELVNLSRNQLQMMALTAGHCHLWGDLFKLEVVKQS
jgi:hypothetical protein